MIQVFAQRDATLSLFKMDLPGKLREDGDLCDWKKWLGGQIMIRCDQQEFMTKIPWPVYPVSCFFWSNHFCSLPMGWPDRHKKCSYTWKCCQPLPSLQSLDQWPFFERCKANRTGQVPRLISSKSPAIDVALEIFASERENRFATKFGGVGGSSAPWYSSAPVVFVCSSALECSKQQQGKCCSSPRYSLAPKKKDDKV